MTTATKRGKRIIGIDPGTLVMGYGIVEIVGETGKDARMVGMGVIKPKTLDDPYRKLAYILEQVSALIEEYGPDEMAIEAPFFGKNVQSMLKLGRAQGVAIAAALHRGLPVTEYAPLKIKMAITGRGTASKEQVADMLQRLLKFDKSEMPKALDATDALGAAYCHYLQSSAPKLKAGYRSWADFVKKNEGRVKG